MSNHSWNHPQGSAAKICFCPDRLFHYGEVTVPSNNSSTQNQLNPSTKKSLMQTSCDFRQFLQFTYGCSVADSVIDVEPGRTIVETLA